MRQTATIGILLCGFLSAPAAYASHHAHAPHAHGHGHHAAPEFPDPASATSPDGIRVLDCWIRAMPARLPSAAYFRIENDSRQTVTLLGVQSPMFEQSMLHSTTTENGMARMTMADSLAIEAGKSLEFSPGGYHAMLEKPAQALQVGTSAPLHFWFEGDQALTVDCDIRPASTLK